MLEQMLFSTSNAVELFDKQPYRYRHRRMRNTQRPADTCILKRNPSKSSIRRLKMYKNAELVNAAKNVQKLPAKKRKGKQGGEKKERGKEGGKEKKKTKRKNRKRRKIKALQKKIRRKKKIRQKMGEVSSCLFWAERIYS